MFSPNMKGVTNHERLSALTYVAMLTLASLVWTRLWCFRQCNEKTSIEGYQNLLVASRIWYNDDIERLWEKNFYEVLGSSRATITIRIKNYENNSTYVRPCDYKKKLAYILQGSLKHPVMIPKATLFELIRPL